jgi:hypothetical protein
MRECGISCGRPNGRAAKWTRSRRDPSPLYGLVSFVCARVSCSGWGLLSLGSEWLGEGEW